MALYDFKTRPFPKTIYRKEKLQTLSNAILRILSKLKLFAINLHFIFLFMIVPLDPLCSIYKYLCSFARKKFKRVKNLSKKNYNRLYNFYSKLYHRYRNIGSLWCNRVKGVMNAEGWTFVPINWPTYLHRWRSPLGTLNNNYCCWLGLVLLSYSNASLSKWVKRFNSDRRGGETTHRLNVAWKCSWSSRATYTQRHTPVCHWFGTYKKERTKLTPPLQRTITTSVTL